MKETPQGEKRDAVLVIEDDGAQLKTIADILETEALQPVCCRTGRQALELCKERELTVAILDLRLPDMDGLELLKQLKQQSNDIKVIIHTGYATLESAVGAVNEEAFAYVRKMGDVEELLAHVHRAFHTNLTSYSKKLEQEIKKRTAQLQNLSAHLQSVLEQERVHIAREIHDELGQALSILQMDLAWLQDRLPEDRQRLLTKKIQSMSKLIGTTIEKVQHVSRELRPSVLDDFGLVAAINWHTKEFKNRTGIKCELNVIEEVEIAEDISTSLFRILQEALTNVVRHAKATRVSIKLIKKEDELILEIKDNGCGISKEQSLDSNSIGIIGMRERVNVLNGSLNIDGAPNKGTRLSVSVPLKRMNGSQNNGSRLAD